MEVLESLRRQAGSPRPALLDARGRCLLTFETLVAGADHLARGLADAGVEPGQRVLCLDVDAPTFAIAAAATLSLGAALVLPTRAAGRARALRLAAAEAPAAVLAGPLGWALVSACAPSLWRAPVCLTAAAAGIAVPGTRSLASVARAARGAPPRAWAEAADPASDAVVSFTSGTTGTPRVVRRGRAVVDAQHAAMRALRDLPAGSVDLAGLPLLALHDLAGGVTVALPPRDRRLLAAALRATGATSLGGFPPLAEALEGEDGGLPALRAIHIGGAPVPPSLLRALARAAPAARVTVVYGCTEAEPVSAVAGSDLLASEGPGRYVGAPWPGIALALPADASGRVMVRGPRVAASGGLGDAGWHDTGDLAARDGQGGLWLQGRAAQVTGPVHSGPPPGLLEVAAERLPWVRRAAAVDGQVVVEPSAWPADPADRRGLRRLAERACQAPVALTRALPRDPRTGKPTLRLLRQAAATAGAGA